MDNVTISVDILCENGDWGTYPGVQLYGEEPQSIDNPSNTFRLWFAWAVGTNRKIQFRDIAGNDYLSDSSYEDDKWYRFRLHYRGNENKADVLITERDNGEVFYQLTDFDFVLNEFSFLATGYYNIPDFGDEWSPIRIDNIFIGRQCDNLCPFGQEMALVDTLLCEGDSLTINEDVYDADQPTGLTIFPGLAQSGCDSVVKVQLSFYEMGYSLGQAEICEGDSIIFNGVVLSSEGIYEHTVLTSEGCDSVAALQVTVLQNYSEEGSAAICQGETYDFFGTPLTEPGLYTESLTASNGCDSLITLDLAVLPAVSENLQSTICQSDTLFFNEQALTEEGTYTAEYQTTQGCDSTVTLELEVLSEFETPISATICEGETYSFNGQELSAAGAYEAEMQSQAGCDSLVVLQLSVAALSETFFDTTLCEGAVLELSGQAFDMVGDYTLQLTDANGCDSTVYLMLDYYPPPLYEVETTPDFGYGYGSLSLALADSTHALIWEDGSTAPERTSLQAGFYYASIEDEWGCVAEIEVEVPAGELRLAMPNTFTPNGDGTNDFFNVIGNAEARVVAFRIFNRWGQQVYNNEYPEQGWDGTTDGKPQPTEVYYYQIEVQTVDGLWTRQGDVTLVR